MVEVVSPTICAHLPSPSPRWGEGWGEGARRPRLFPTIARDQQFAPDRFEHAVRVGEHVIVPETKHPIAVFLDDCGPGCVAHGVMAAAVELDRQPRSAAGEIGDVAVDLGLADELLASEPARAEPGPEAFFSVGLIGAQLAGDRSEALSSQLSTPSPNPLPHGERAYCGALVNAHVC